MEPLPPPPQPGYVDPLLTNVGYMPQSNIHQDAMMSKHLDASEILIRLKNTLMGLEYDDTEEEWKPVMVTLGFDEDGNEIKEKESPLMDPRDIRLIISSLHMYLNSNTFLSLLDDERINDIMWDISQNLAILFYNVRNKISPHERSILWAQIEHSILFALYRAKGKITLDAISKTQQSHEIIQTAPSTPTEQQKEFKILGW